MHLRKKVTFFKFSITAMIMMGIALALTVAGLSISGATPVAASRGETEACQNCHTYHGGNLRITTDTTAITVTPGASFAISVNWTDGGNSRTEINWPDTLNNNLFSPTPRVPFSAVASTGSTSSTLTAPAAGTYTVRVYSVQRSPNQSDYKDMTITVAAAAPSITTSSLANGTVGTAYSQTLDATGGTTPFTWSLSAGSLPAGLWLSSGGAITGTPTIAGTSGFTIMVTDSAAATATQDLSITVNPMEPPSITTTSLSAGTVGVAYNQAITATGGALPYAWSLQAGSLPDGLTLASDGVILGTPTVTGASGFTVMVTDGNGTTDTQDLSITVNPAVLPGILTSSLPAGTVGAAYNRSLSVIGGTPPFTWSLQAGSLPDGLSLSPDGVITGTPTASGASSFTVMVTDGTEATASRDLSITVNPGSQKPPKSDGKGGHDRDGKDNKEREDHDRDNPNNEGEDEDRDDPENNQGEHEDRDRSENNQGEDRDRDRHDGEAPRLDDRDEDTPGVQTAREENTERNRPDSLRHPEGRNLTDRGNEAEERED